MINAVNIPALFKDLAYEMGQELKVNLNFIYGHGVEIVGRLQMMQKSSEAYRRFPVMALLMDFPETVGQASGYHAEIQVTVILATLSNQHYTTEERYEKVIIPKLYPLYDSLMNQLQRSKGFDCTNPDLVKHTKIDRPFYGREGLYANTANIFNDVVDAIELKNLTLKVKKQSCKPKENAILA